MSDETPRHGEPDEPAESQDVFPPADDWVEDAVDPDEAPIEAEIVDEGAIEPVQPESPDDALASPEVLAGLASPFAQREGGRDRQSVRRLIGLAGRTTVGALVTAVAVVVTVGATLVTPPALTSTAPKPIVATPAPAAQQLVCPGGLLRLADSSGSDASKASPLGPVATAWASSGDARGVTTRNVGTTNSGASGTTSLAEIGTVAPAAGAAPAASGFQSQLLVGETRGVATASCQSPESDEWLVGGATTLGRTSLVVVTNPSATEATVALEVYGPDGLVAASGTSGIRLAPDEQRVIPLNGLVVDLDAPVVHVTSTGGRVVASIEQTILRTLTPGGADWSGAQQPSEQLTIPGVHVTDPTALAPIDLSETDHVDVDPVVRLFAPPDAAGDTTPLTATIAWIPDGSTLADALAARDTGAAGSGGDDQGPTDAGASASPVAAAPRSMDVSLTRGVTTELPVTGLGAGDYTVVVVAAAPVVGAVRASTIADAGLADPVLAGGSDFAWFQPGAPLGDTAAIEVPDLAREPGSEATQAATLTTVLWVANPTDAAATVTITPEGGAAQRIELAPGTAGHVALPVGATVALAGVAGLSAAVVTAGPGLLAQSPLEAPPPSASAVRVHL